VAVEAVSTFVVKISLDFQEIFARHFDFSSLTFAKIKKHGAGKAIGRIKEPEFANLPSNKSWPKKLLVEATECMSFRGGEGNNLKTRCLLDQPSPMSILGTVHRP
jgi:hypothetical protein